MFKRTGTLFSRCWASCHVSVGPNNHSVLYSEPSVLSFYTGGFVWRADEEQEGEGGMDFLAPTEESTSAAGGGSGSGGTSWAALLTLEAVHRMLSTPHLALELFR